LSHHRSDAQQRANAEATVSGLSLAFGFVLMEEVLQSAA